MRSRRRTQAKQLEVAALLVAAVGVLTEYLTDVPGFPLVPPGPIILTAAAAVVALVRFRWAPAVGVLAAVFLSVGAVASGRTAHVLASPSAFGPWIGAVVQVAGLIAAVIAGVVALIEGPRS